MSADPMRENDFELAKLLVLRMGFENRGKLLGYLAGALVMLDHIPPEKIMKTIDVKDLMKLIGK